MIGERLKRARIASGLSMDQLARMVGVSANMIKKYEHNKNMPTSSRLISLAQALDIRVEYFFRPIHCQLSDLEYRKRKRSTQTAINKIKEHVMDQAERWFELKSLWPLFPIQEFVIPSSLPKEINLLEQVEEIADTIRLEWNLGFNPIPDVISMLETQGMLILITNAGSQKDFDGLQAKINNQPIIVCTDYNDGARQRFTLAHELGHLLLKNRIGKDMDEEKVCNRFAGALLFPQSSVQQYFGKKRNTIEFQELYHLKHIFGISMQACLRRIADLSIISHNTYKYMMIEFGKRGWRTCEPEKPYPKEETHVFRRLVFRALGEGIIGESKAAELLKEPLMQFYRERSLESL